MGYMQHETLFDMVSKFVKLVWALVIVAAILALLGGGLYGCGLFLRWIIHP